MKRLLTGSPFAPLMRALCLVITTLSCTSLQAAAPVLLDGDTPRRDLAADVRYLLDSAGTATLEQLREDPDAFRPLPGDRVDFGFTDDVIWLRLEVANVTARPLQQLLAFNMRFMQKLDGWLVLDGNAELLVHNHFDTPFDERPIPHRHLTVPFELPPEARATIFIRYASEGATAIPLSIESRLSFAELSGFHNAKNAAFYGFVAFMFSYSLLFMTLLRVRLFFFYALYLSTVTLYVFHMDGYTFKYLWPDLPAWNSFAALPLGLSFAFGAALFSQEFLETKARHPVIHRVMIGVIVTTLLLLASAVLVSDALVKRVSFPFTFLVAVICLISGIVALRQHAIGTRFYVAGWTGITVAALVSNFAHFNAGLLAINVSFEIMRIGILIDATMMALAIVDRINGLRRERDAAVANEASLMQEMLGLHDRFLVLENRYATARSLAEARGLKLASAGHDLRQPLAALRATMQSLKQQNGSNPDSTDELRGALTYLERLVDDVMKSAMAVDVSTDAPQSTRDEGDAENDWEATREVFPVQLLLDNVYQMFQQDAADRGMELRCVRSSQQVNGPVLAVMRILANLVSNAVKYSDGDRVLVGCRRNGDLVQIEVIDRGPGFDTKQLGLLSTAFVRGDGAAKKADGNGLGLGIVRELVLAHNLGFRIDSSLAAGTRARLLVPRA